MDVLGEPEALVQVLESPSFRRASGVQRRRRRRIWRPASPRAGQRQHGHGGAGLYCVYCIYIIYDYSRLDSNRYMYI